MRVIFPTETHLMEFVSDIPVRSKLRNILRELCATKVRGAFDEIDDEGTVEVYAPGNSRLWILSLSALSQRAHNAITHKIVKDDRQL